MRIVYCIPHLYNSGGMERVLTQKINWLVAHTDYVISVLTTENVPGGIKPIYFPLDTHVEVVHLNIDFNADYDKPLPAKWLGHVRRMRSYKKALNDYIRVNAIDLCISLGGKEIAFLHSLSCRTMVEFHFAKNHRAQLLATQHSGLFWRWLGSMRTRQLVRGVKKLKQVVVLTLADKREWESTGCTNIVCIPNPCSLDLQNAPDLTAKKNIVLAVGRLHEQKGFDMLLQAWKPIESAHPDWQLRIVGEGFQRVALEQQIQYLQLQNVTLAGQTKEMAREYAAASCFVLSSRYEGMPLALIEAMWCGLPCVAFDCPYGPSELLAKDRGILVPTQDVLQLTKNLEYIITHPEEAHQYAVKAQIYAQNTFNEDHIMQQWVAQIEKC